MMISTTKPGFFGSNSPSSPRLLEPLAAGSRRGARNALPVTRTPVSADAVEDAPTGSVDDPSRPRSDLPSLQTRDENGALQLLDFSLSSVHDRVDISRQGFGHLLGDYTRQEISFSAVQRNTDGSRTWLQVNMIHERLQVRFDQDRPADKAKDQADTGRNPAPPPSIGDLLARLTEQFTPEKVAGRITDFARSGFDRFRNGGADSADSRGAFRDFITPYIDKGYGQALDLLGDLIPDNVRSLLSRTRDLVDARLADFVNGNGASPAEAAPALPASTAPAPLVDVRA